VLYSQGQQPERANKEGCRDREYSSGVQHNQVRPWVQSSAPLNEEKKDRKKRKRRKKEGREGKEG
jgi:hypothetical protein